LTIKAPAALRHVDGFPVLKLLRPLRHPRPRGPQAIPYPSKPNVRAWLRPPVRPLDRSRWSSLGGGRLQTARDKPSYSTDLALTRRGEECELSPLGSGI